MHGAELEAKTQEWKHKYFESLAQLEAKEGEWAELERVLRSALSGLSLAIDGLDPGLDKALDKLRQGLRKGLRGDKLLGLVGQISKTVEGVHRGAPSSTAAPASLLLDLLDSLQLPKGMARAAKGLKKRLAKTAEPSAADLDAFAQLIHDAFDWLQGDAGTAPAPAQTGLLGRWLGAKGKPSTAASDTAPASDPIGVARAVLDILLGQTRLPEHYHGEREPIAARLPKAASAADLNRLAEQFAALLNELFDADDSVAGADLSLNEALLILLQRLECPKDLENELQVLSERLAGEVANSDWPALLEDIAALVAQMRRKVQEEKKDLEDFLAQLTDQLKGLDDSIRDIESGRIEAVDHGKELDSAVSEQVRGIASSVHQATHLNDLKQSVQSRLNAIAEHMASFREAEVQRDETAKRRIQDLDRRLRATEQEAEDLRMRVARERKSALIDALTGVPNRMAYEERIEQEHVRWKRFDEPLSMVVVDLDLFKKINDNYGHLAGDKVLRTVARLLQTKIREADFLARYGGEEFVILMPGAGSDAALTVVDKLRREVEHCGFHYRGDHVPITFSAGVAEFHGNDQPAAVFARADAALYEAKAAGRNTCRAAPRP